MPSKSESVGESLPGRDAWSVVMILLCVGLGLLLGRGAILDAIARGGCYLIKYKCLLDALGCLRSQEVKYLLAISFLGLNCRTVAGFEASTESRHSS